MCSECYKDYDNKLICPICKEESAVTEINASKCDYFTEMPVNIYFKKLYAQNVDSIGKEILYDLCVEYYKFLHLASKYEDIAPSYWIDKIWRAHMIDNESYNAACMLMFDKIIHYDSKLLSLRGCCSYYAKYLITIDLCFFDVDNVLWRPIDTRTKNILDVKKETIISLNIFRDRREINIAVPNIFTISDLKRLINIEEGNDDDMRLFYAGRCFLGDRILRDIEISGDRKIHVTPNMRGD